MGGKRMRRGARSPSSASSSTTVLRRRLLSSNISLSPSNIDAVVSHLRSAFPDYSRIKEQTLRSFVDITLHDIDYENEKQRKSSKKSNNSKEDESEQRLARAEAKHLMKRRAVSKNNSSDSDMSGDGSTSTSEESSDAVFEAKFEPEVDLMKSMMRDKYGKMTAKPKMKQEDDNMEIEIIHDKKKTETMGPTNTNRRRGKSLEKLASSGNNGEVVMKNEGPRFKDLGGMNGVLEQLEQEVLVPLCQPQLLEFLGVRPMAGILLHGPPGCGKTKLAHAIANETCVPFYKISATEIVSGVSGASEENIRDLFKKAYRTAPSIVFIDEIDAIASKRENLQREMERRIVTQLMTCMDESHQSLQSNDNNDSESETSNRKPSYVLVIGATNRPDAVDQALRRPGRFDREIALGVPDENARFEILSVLIKKLRVDGDFDLTKIARSTPGFVGADLAALVNKAGNLAMKRITDKRKSEYKGERIDDWWRQPWSQEEMESLSIIMSDFEDAIKMVQPSLRREGFSAIPNTKWEDVGGLNSLRKEFDRYIVQRIKNPEDYEKLGVSMEVGFLLYGPPGCGKTLIAKAVANEAGANFIHIKGPELLNKYVGESELAVRTIFSRARTCSPCILFFDEVDALTTQRGKDGGWVVERLLNQLLIELDGADQRQGVYVVGATNRPEVMDLAVLRPGRFGKKLYVPLPSAEERGLILKTLARNKPIASDVNLDAIGCREACHNLTGADLSALMNEAAMAALEEKHVAIENGNSYVKSLVIETSHFEKALVKISPSVSEEQRIYYDTLSKNI